jgi:tetratricopeptide (TPR) repeat protein
MNGDEMGVGALVATADGYFSSRCMSDAAVYYWKALDVSPCNVHVLHRMGLASVHLNDLDGAHGYIQRALRVDPCHAELWEHAGLLAAGRGQYESAEAAYRRAICLAGDTASLHRNLADCLHLSGRLDDAMMHYEQSLAIEPGLHHAVRALAQINAELGRADKATEFWIRAWALRPAASKDDLDNIVERTKDRYVAALEKAIREIRSCFCADVAALKAVAYVLNNSLRYEDAFAVAQQGLALDPRDAILNHYAAWALRRLGRVVQCRAYSGKAAMALPDNPLVQYEFSDVLLCLGEFEEGWKLHKAFYEISENRARMFWPNFPEWHGEPVFGRQFLLIGEQGLGDQIQFLRFAEWLHRQGASVDVLVDRPIAVLASSMAAVSRVFTAMPPGPYDYWCHMFAAAEHINLGLPMLPVAMPYLAAGSEKVHRWRAVIESTSQARKPAKHGRIGITYAGGPGLYLDRFRSIQLDTLKELFAVPDTTWYSVQKGNREREIETLAKHFDIHMLGPAIRDFADTLAILHSLDLLITVDTSVAHLAGAARLPVWVLVPAYTDWRWMTEGRDSPWYPSMRLFRQRELGNWTPVIEEVGGALREWCDARGDGLKN